MLPPTEQSPFEPGSLTDLEGAHRLFDRYPMYRQGLEWIEQFVMQPAAELGRPGHVCPRLAPAVKQNQIYLVAVRTESASTEEAIRRVRPLADLYAEVFADPEDFRAGSLLAFFPDVPLRQAAEFIDGGHRELRIEFVRRGQMLGEFHPDSTVGSVRNVAFPVMRSPVPMFAVRALTTHDLMFLDQPQTPPALRAEYLRLYLRHLDDQISVATRNRAKAGLELAEAEAGVASWT